MKYIQKQLEDKFGHLNECWRVTNISISLVDDYQTNADGTQTKIGEHFQAIVTVKGWKDLTAFNENKPEVGKRTIIISPCEDLTNFQVIYDEIAGKILEDVQFSGGTIIDTTA